MTDLSQIKVEKKDGSQQPWVRNKLVQGMVKAGATLDQAEGIASQVEEWTLGNSTDGVIPSSQIRAKVIELLELSNPTARQAYEAYRKEE